MIGQVGKHWHIILADLALILFVLTLSALSKTLPVDGDDQTESPSPEQAQFDPAQTLYRPVSGDPRLANGSTASRATRARRLRSMSVIRKTTAEVHGHPRARLAKRQRAADLPCAPWFPGGKIRDLRHSGLRHAAVTR